MPFGGLMDISSPDKVQLQNSLDFAVKIFNVIDKLKPNCYIFHGSGEPIPQDLRKGMLEELTNSVNFLTSKTDIPVCIENLPRTCLLNTSKELNEFLKTVPKAYVCLDTNHFLSEKPEDAIINIGKVIKTLHIADYDYLDERHWLPTQGAIDWQKVIGALEKIGYDGVFNYELCPNYDFEQIKENYDKLFNAYNKQ
jgi:sugar phosphate isomerase/epimerase